MRSRSRFGRTVRQATQDRFGTRRTDPAAAGRYDDTSSAAGVASARISSDVDAPSVAGSTAAFLTRGRASAWPAPRPRSRPPSRWLGRRRRRRPPRVRQPSSWRARRASAGRRASASVTAVRAAASAPSAGASDAAVLVREARFGLAGASTVSLRGRRHPLVAAASAASACSVSAAAFASATDTSLRMSMRQPVEARGEPRVLALAADGQQASARGR